MIIENHVKILPILSFVKKGIFRLLGLNIIISQSEAAKNTTNTSFNNFLLLHLILFLHDRQFQKT